LSILGGYEPLATVSSIPIYKYPSTTDLLRIPSLLYSPSTNPSHPHRILKLFLKIGNVLTTRLRALLQWWAPFLYTNIPPPPTSSASHLCSICHPQIHRTPSHQEKKVRDEGGMEWRRPWISTFSPMLCNLPNLLPNQCCATCRTINDKIAQTNKTQLRTGTNHQTSLKRAH
jgi:hypothetical protein